MWRQCWVPGSLLEIPLLSSEAGACRGSGRSAFPVVGLAALIQHLSFQPHSGLRLHRERDACDHDGPPCAVAEVKPLTDFAPAAWMQMQS